MSPTRRRRKKTPKHIFSDTGGLNHDASDDNSRHPSEEATAVSLSSKVCTAVGFLLYVNSIWLCGFCFDDKSAIIKNPDVLNMSGDGIMSSWFYVFRHDFWGTNVRSAQSHKSYRPLVILSFRLDALLSGGEAWCFHLTNAVLHAGTCWLLFSYMSVISGEKLLSSSGTTGGSRRRLASPFKAAILLSGLWFASHPIHTDAVTGLVGRAELLAAILCLVGATFCQRRELWWAAMACFFAACFCKETAVVVPVVLAAVDVASRFLSPTPETVSLHRAASTAAAPVAYLCFRSWLFSGSPGGSALSTVRVQDNFLLHLGPMNKLRTALYIQAMYVRLLVWPGSRLSCDYSLGALEPVIGWVSREMAFTAAVASTVVAWAWYGLVRLRHAGDTIPLLALGWTFGPLVPASHLVGIGTVLAERLLYMPSIGMTLLIFHGITCITKASLRGATAAAKAALIGCILLFAHQTIFRNPDWADSDTLHFADIATYPDSLKLLLSCAEKAIPTDRDLALRYAENAQRVLERHSDVLTGAPYGTVLPLIARIKVQRDDPNYRVWAPGALEAIEELLVYSDKGSDKILSEAHRVQWHQVRDAIKVMMTGPG